jgi:hypothetical protein
MEHVMGELNYWTEVMTRWGVGWIAGGENTAHGKMAGFFAQPYISPPDYDTVDFPSMKEILLIQQSSVNEYERCQQSNATAGQEVPPQQVDAVLCVAKDETSVDIMRRRLCCNFWR